MTDKGCFAYSDEEIYANNAAHLMTGPQLKFLCAILNSSIVSWFVSKTGSTTGMGRIQWTKFVVESIPIPDPGCLEQKFEDIVDLMSRNSQFKEQDVEMQLDQLAFALYGITASEQRAVWSAV